MTPSRREQLNARQAEISGPERKAGYHYCFENKDRVTGPIDAEWQRCHCPAKKQYRARPV